MSGTDKPEFPAAPERNSGGALGASWAVLLTMGGTSMVYNLWHATHGGHMNIWLALPAGMAPVLAAMLLSHIVGASRGGTWMRVAAGLIMVGAMSLSMSATAAVVAPALGTGWRWLFGLVIDAAALLAFQVILSDRHQRSAEAGAVAVAQEAAAEAELRAAEAGRLAELRAEQFRSEMAALRAELEAAQATAVPLPPARSSARRPKRSSVRKAAPAKAAADDGGDLTVEAQALAIIDAEPDINGAELGRRLGVAEGYGRQLKRRLASVGTGQQGETGTET